MLLLYFMRLHGCASLFQVLRLYVVPQVGPAQVVSAERRLTSPARSSSSPARPAAPQAAVQRGVAGPTAAADAGHTSSAASAALPPAAHAAAVPGDGRSAQEGQQAAAYVHSSDGGSSSSSSSRRKREEADEALLLNIAERDLAEVANAIAAAAGPGLDAELAALLSGMTEAGVTTAAPAAWQREDGSGAGAAPAPAAAVAAAGPESADVPAADTTSMHAGSSDQQERGQQPGGAQAAVLNSCTQPADAASASQMDAAAGAAASSSGLRLPQTLPGVRSWRGADGAAGGSSGCNPSLPSGTVDGSMQSPNIPNNETGMRQRAHS